MTTKAETKTTDVRAEPNPRWIRGTLDGRPVIDTRDSVFVWEHPYYPQWYVPRHDLRAELVDRGTTKQSDRLGTATVYDLIVRSGDATVTVEAGAMAYHHSPVEEIRDLVKVDWDAMDAWFEEDVEVFVHPRSPYTRVDVLPSTRQVTVRIDGEIIADSSRPFILYETGLPPRYYLPMEDVRTELLTPSELSTGCPYKGVARYWHVTVGDNVHEDVVWGYDDPLPESALVKAMVCFYDEKVDLSVT